MDFDIDELEDFSPESIAHTIFGSDPKPPCSNQMIATQDTVDCVYLMEILITILMEGFQMFTNGFEEIDLKKFSVEYINALDPWMRSLGFRVITSVCNKKEKASYEDYYCKIIIRTKLQENLFIMKNISKKYHFFINGQFLEANKKKDKLSDLSAVFINDETDDAFVIRFDACYS
jgi:hypothetical protein